MNIFKNIPLGLKLFGSVRRYDYFDKDIKIARDAGDCKKEQELIAHATSVWTDAVFDIYDIDLTVTGKEKIPKDAPCVFISNHQGYADIILLFKATDGMQISFVAKENLEKVPCIGKWIGLTRGVFIKRGDAREAVKSIQDGVDLIKKGYNLVIFPEGTRSRGPVMNEFKHGSFKLATKAKAVIIPVSINGSYKMFEEREVITKGCHAELMFHDPIPTSDLDRKQIADLPVEVEKIIRDGLAELVAKDNENK